MNNNYMNNDKEVSPDSIWIEEIVDNRTALKFRVKEILYSRKSPYQNVTVVDTYHHGKMLLNDGLVMCSERDEWSYHEMMAHVPMFSHPNPQRVLIIGGGDGGTAREVLRHSNVSKCVLVEIDELVVEACKEFFWQTAKVFDEEDRLELVIEDGVKFVKNYKEKFDVILIDSTDPIGPAAPLFNEDFYQDIYHLLNDGGIVVSQGESPFYMKESQLVLAKIMSSVFPLFTTYNFSNLTYPGGLWSFLLSVKGKNLELQNKDLFMDLKYYNFNIHKGAFCLPQFQLSTLKEAVPNFHIIDLKK